METDVYSLHSRWVLKQNKTKQKTLEKQHTLTPGNTSDQPRDRPIGSNAESQKKQFGFLWLPPDTLELTRFVVLLMTRGAVQRLAMQDGVSSSF